jgi:hypothetical protein
MIDDASLGVEIRVARWLVSGHPSEIEVALSNRGNETIWEVVIELRSAGLARGSGLHHMKPPLLKGAFRRLAKVAVGPGLPGVYPNATLWVSILTARGRLVGIGELPVSIVVAKEPPTLQHLHIGDKAFWGVVCDGDLKLPAEPTFNQMIRHHFDEAKWNPVDLTWNRSGSRWGQFKGALFAALLALIFCAAWGIVHREIDGANSGSVSLPNPPPDNRSDTPRPVQWTNSLGMEFVSLPRCDKADAGKKLSICVHETRRIDFERFAKAVSFVLPLWQGRGDEFNANHDNVPVVGVPWDRITAEDAERASGTTFCGWLTQFERQSGVIGSQSFYRLPTDHEWSCAVGLGEAESSMRLELPSAKSGGFSDQFPWGTSPIPISGNYADSSAQAHGFADPVFSSYDDKFPALAPVKSFAPNGAGIYDLGGNVWEWTSSHLATAVGSDWVVRGGSWRSGTVPEGLSSARTTPVSLNRGDVGFRLILEIPDDEGN